MGALPQRLAALVTPGPPLTDTQRRRYARHISLDAVGEVGQRRLRSAAIAVVGAGGLGSPVISYLAAAGVGRLGVIDDDTVETSNLQRQVIHGDGDVGASKAHSAAEAVTRLNPEVEVRVHAERLTAANAAELLGGYDLVVDGTDNSATRYVVNDACVTLGVPEVWGAVEQTYGQVTVFWGQPPATSGITPIQLRDIFPDDQAADSARSCAQAGVLGALCGSVGSIMATEAIKLITGGGRPLLGRLLLVDDWAGTQRTVRVAPSGQRPAPPGVSPGDSGAPARVAPASSALADVALSDAMATDGPDSVSAMDLALGLDGDKPWTVVDVRPAHERMLASLPGAIDLEVAQIADGTAARLLAQRPGPVAVYCHHGVRSLAAARELRAQGIQARHLLGGAVAWHELAGTYALGE